MESGATGNLRKAIPVPQGTHQGAACGYHRLPVADCPASGQLQCIAGGATQQQQQQQQPALSGAPVNKMAVNYHEGEMDPSRSRVWWNSSSLRDIFVPHRGSA